VKELKEARNTVEQWAVNSEDQNAEDWGKKSRAEEMTPGNLVGKMNMITSVPFYWLKQLTKSIFIIGIGKIKSKANLFQTKENKVFYFNIGSLNGKNNYLSF
jgi:hypothetical protein